MIIIHSSFLKNRSRRTKREEIRQRAGVRLPISELSDTRRENSSADPADEVLGKE